MTLDQIRAQFAEHLRVKGALRSDRLVEAVSRVPRERFLGAGPWHVRAEGSAAAVVTDDADPRHVYQNAAIAIDPTRDLYNGQPGQIAGWIDGLDVAPGERVLHIGCGTGYYTALLAHIVGPAGRVFAVEVDRALATRATSSLSEWPWVEVTTGDGYSSLPTDIDVVLVHAGASHVRDEWLDATRDGARVAMMLTCTMPGIPSTLGKGMVLTLRRTGRDWHARLTTMVMAYSLVGGRDEAMNAALGRAFLTRQMAGVTRLRRDAHEPAASCWLHAPTTCLTSA